MDKNNNVMLQKCLETHARRTQTGGICTDCFLKDMAVYFPVEYGVKIIKGASEKGGEVM